LPNQPAPGKNDKHKPPAYRGYRHAALDPLVAAYQVLDAQLGRFASPEEAVENMQRLFLSRIQGILDPANRNKRIGEMTRNSAPTRLAEDVPDALNPDPSEIPSGADALLEGWPNPQRKSWGPPRDPIR